MKPERLYITLISIIVVVEVIVKGFLFVVIVNKMYTNILEEAKQTVQYNIVLCVLI